MQTTRRRAPLVAVVGLAVVALLASCGTVSAFLDLQTALDNAGFTSIKVNLDSGVEDGSGLRVEAKGPGGETAAEALDKAARITWTEFPRKFEFLALRIDGVSKSYTRAQLQEKFGPRPANLDKKTLADDTRSIGIGVLVGFVVAFVLAILVLVLVLVLVRRSRKRKLAAVQAAWAAQAAGQYPPGYGYGPPGYPAAPGQPAPPPSAPQPPPGGFPPPPMPPQAPPSPPSPPNQTPPGWG